MSGWGGGGSAGEKGNRLGKQIRRMGRPKVPLLRKEEEVGEADLDRKEEKQLWPELFSSPIYPFFLDLLSFFLLPQQPFRSRQMLKNGGGKKVWTWGREMAHCLKEKKKGLFARFSYMCSVAWHRLLDVKNRESTLRFWRRISSQLDESQTGRGE